MLYCYSNLKELVKSPDNYYKEIKSDKINLVSSYWIRSFIHFYEEYVKNENNPIFFERKYVLIKYYSGSQLTTTYPEENCSYPGPVNNYILVDQRSSLNRNKSLNNFKCMHNTKMNINKDYYVVDNELYNKLKMIFKSTFDIEYLLPDNIPRISKEIQNYLKFPSVLCSIYHSSLLSFPKIIQITDSKENIVLENILNEINSANLESNEIQLDLIDKNIKIYQYNGEELDFYNENLEIALGIKTKISNKIQILNKNEAIPNNSLIFIHILKEDQIDFFYYSINICYKCGKNVLNDENNETNNEITISKIKYLGHFFCSKNCVESERDSLKSVKDTFNSFFKEKFKLETLINNSFVSLVPINSKLSGRRGLKNLGNTCFMNSAIQCLSHSEELTKYFLMKNHIAEINKSSKLGSEGQIALSFYNLINSLWNGSDSDTYLSPYDFKQIFVKFFQQFAGFSQHDSHEMLNYMLDALHEDLNRIKSKPYIEINEKQKHESLDEASERWWKTHIKRENSIITDLFHGQYMSVIECPKCSNVVTTFDPYMILSLPIPGNSTKLIKFHLVNDDQEYRLMTESIDESMSVGELIEKISDHIKIDRRFIIPIIISPSNKIARKIPNSTTSVFNIYSCNYELLFFTHKDRMFLNMYNDRINKKRLVIIIVGRLLTIKDDDRDIIEIKPFLYPQPFIVRYEDKLSDFKIRMFGVYRKYMIKITENSDTSNDNSNDEYKRDRKMSSDYSEFLNKKEDFDFLTKESKLYYNYKSKTEEKYNLNLYFFNNNPELSIDREAKCSYCNLSNCDYCELKHVDNDFDDFCKRINQDQPVIALYNITSEISSESLYQVSSLLKLNDVTDKNEHKSQNSVSIYDCFDLFKTREILMEDNTWYCGICKDHIRAYKTYMIKKLPLYLIIHFNRFKVRSTNVILSRFLNKKNDALIEYPINDLILNDYVVKDESDKHNYKYELFAVNQHYGTMQGGHYTCVVKNKLGNKDKWFMYDDDRVYEIDESKVIDESAYVLFYKRVLN